MNAINKLGIKIVGVLVLLAVVVWLAWLGISQLLSRSTPPPETEVDPQTDTDADGLPDLFEGYYQTDPTNPDTDRDGTSDFNELLEGRDPTASAAEASDEATLPTGENVLDTSTFTGQYLASLPTTIDRSEILERERVEAFIEENREQLLEPLPEDTVQSTEGSGLTVVSDYLDAVSASHNDELVPIDDALIERALTEQLQVNPAPMEQLVLDLEHNFDTLADVVAPSETADLHELILTATAQLRDNVRHLRDINDDFVRGLAASKNIDELGQTFQQIADHVAGLEDLYGLE